MSNLPDSITIEQLPDASDNETVDESEPDAEEEIDQLDSDSDLPADQQPEAPVPKKPTHPKAGERRPGQTLLPAVRVENILQADGVLGNLNLSKEGIFLLSIATEEFIRRLVKAGHQRASDQSRTMVRYHDMASVARNQYEFKFLQDTIPTTRTLASALALRTRREQELLEHDPAMQFQNGRARPPRHPELPHALSTPTVSGDSFVPILEPSEDGPQCPVSDPGAPSPDGSTLGLRPTPPNAPNADAEPQLAKKRSHCARRSYTPSFNRPQSRKNNASIPQNPYPTSNASTSTITERTQTWEEWKEKSRRLYGTGDDSRRKSLQSSSNLSNGASSSHRSPPRDPPSSEDVPRSFPPIAQWDRPEPSTDPVDYAEGHRNSPLTRPPITLLNGDSPPKHLDHSAEKPATYVPAQESWAGPLTGPGSAFLQGPGGPFPRPPPPEPLAPAPASAPSPPAAPAPGRTIYALDNPAD